MVEGALTPSFWWMLDGRGETYRTNDLASRDLIQQCAHLDGYTVHANVFLNSVLNNSDFVVCRDEVQEGLARWRSNAEHGIEHSYNVFQMALRIAKEDRLEVDTYSLFVLSLTHDLAEFLPLIDPQTGRVAQREVDAFGDGDSERGLKLWKEQRHDRLMAAMIRQVRESFPEMGLPSTMSYDVRHHDIFWSRPDRATMGRVAQNLSLEGKVLADADRLVTGSSESMSIADAIEFNIARSAGYGRGKEYFFRNLSPEDRLSWKKRSGGYFDCLSALLVEFTAPDYMFHTNFGKRRNALKRELFPEQLAAYLQQSYETYMTQLEPVMGDGGAIEIECGIRGDDERFTVRAASIREAALYVQSVPVVGKQSVEGREYFAYSFVVDGNWIDPSIVAYESYRELQYAVLGSVEDYHTFIHSR